MAKNSICMNALLFTDLHTSKKALKKVFDFINDEKNQINAMFFAGDFVNMGEPVEYQEEFIRYHTKHPTPLFWVPGNNDFGRSYKLMQGYLPSVEGRVEEYNGLNITGVGGSPASWAGEYQGEKKIKRDKIKDSIFISHQPPPNLYDLKKTDHSPAPMKKFPDSPKIHICGHFHNQWGIGYIGQTKVVKLAASYLGFAAIMNLENLKVKFIEL